jgi:aspartate/methionine/tyrosine aminotransferase
LINPNNPTGSFIKRDQLVAILELCAERQVALICDEVFADYAFGAVEDVVPSIAFSSEALSFALSGVSKLLGLPQMKLAWIAAGGPDRLLTEALERLEVISDTYLSVSTPAQRALPTWLRLRDEMTGQVLSRLRANYDFLREAVGDLIQCLRAEGGWYAVLKIPSVGDDEEFAIELLRREGVLVHPGYFFGFDEDGILVVSLLPRAEVFREGMTRLVKMAAG